jgi:hypothetical protein
VAIKYLHQHFPLKARQNMPKIGIFGFENLPSGNPAPAKIFAGTFN